MSNLLATTVQFAFFTLMMAKREKFFTVKGVEFAEWEVVIIFSIVTSVVCASLLCKKTLINVNQTPLRLTAQCVFKISTHREILVWFFAAAILCTQNALVTTLGPILCALFAKSRFVTQCCLKLHMMLKLQRPLCQMSTSTTKWQWSTTIATTHLKWGSTWWVVNANNVVLTILHRPVV